MLTTGVFVHILSISAALNQPTYLDWRSHASFEL